jgi:hypothetical protein
MREMQKTFHPDPLDFRVREKENGMSKMQKPQSQAADFLLSGGDIQEELGWPMEINRLPATGSKHGYPSLTR